MKISVLYLGLLVFSLFLYSCDDSETTTESFDQKELLENMADNLIIPSYQDFQSKAASLSSSIEAFTQNPSTQTLEQAQNDWKNTYLAWQSANMYNFGPAQGTFGSLLENIGTFPVDASQIEIYISAADASLNNFDRDTRGLLGIEYLLFGNGSAEVVNAFTSSDLAQERKEYLLAITADIQDNINQVLNGWNSGYRDSFVNNTGTDNGSSVSLLFNNFNQSFESIKNFKLGLPLGARAGQTSSEPSLVEAYYSEESIMFLKSHFDNIERVWTGTRMNGSEGIGFEEYLESIDNTESLITDTKSQIASVKAKINALPSTSLQEQIRSNDQSANELLTELQKLTRFLKTEMASLLAISITYDSGDGD